MKSSKTILITGCSSGIGYSAAAELKKRGHHVIATARKLEDVGRLKKEGFAILAVEPNISFYDGLTIVSYQEAITEADIVVFLVAHKEFRGLKVTNALDFCGVLDME